MLVLDQRLGALLQLGELALGLLQLVAQGAQLGLQVILGDLNLLLMLMAQFEEQFDKDLAGGGEGDALVRWGRAFGGEKGVPRATEVFLGDFLVGLSVLAADLSALLRGEVAVGVPSAFDRSLLQQLAQGVLVCGGKGRIDAEGQLHGIP